MNEEIQQYLIPGKKNILAIYVLYLFWMLLPSLTFVGLVFAYANINNSSPFLRNHYVFAFRNGAIAITAFIVGGLLAMTAIGQLVYLLALVWFLVRSMIALNLLFKDRSHPNPLTWWIK